MSRCRLPIRAARSRLAASPSIFGCASTSTATWSRRSWPAGPTHHEGVERVPGLARLGCDAARAAASDLAALGDLLVHLTDLADGDAHLRGLDRERRRRHDPRAPDRDAVAADAGLWAGRCDRHHARVRDGILPRALQSVR